MSKFTDKVKADLGVEFTPEVITEYSHYLAIFCSEYFNEWFDPKLFNFKYVNFLEQYCSKHASKWLNCGYNTVDPAFEKGIYQEAILRTYKVLDNVKFAVKNPEVDLGIEWISTDPIREYGNLKQLEAMSGNLSECFATISPDVNLRNLEKIVKDVVGEEFYKDNEIELEIGIWFIREAYRLSDPNEPNLNSIALFHHFETK